MGIQLLDILFAKRCDVKYLVRDQYRGGLQGLAQKMGLDPGPMHQAGIDAVTTRNVFFALPGLSARAFARSADLGLLFGLGGDFKGPNAIAVRARIPERMLREMRRQWLENRPAHDYSRNWQYSDASPGSYASYGLGWQQQEWRGGWEGEWFPLDQWGSTPFSSGGGLVY